MTACDRKTAPWLRGLGVFRRNKVGDRLVIRVDGVSHEVVKLDGNTASVVLACAPGGLALLVDPSTLVYAYGEIDVDCMTCLVRRAWVT